MNLDARIQWILDNLKQPSGDAWNQKALARAMGLPSAAHVGMVVRGEIEDPRGSFFATLVRVTGVNARWLLLGEGEPLGPEPTAPPTDLSDRPHWKNLPNWRELVASAKVLAPTMPPWVWERIADSSPMLSSPPTPAMLASLADLYLKHEPPPSPGSRQESGPRRKGG